MESYRDEQVFGHLNLERCRTPKTCHTRPQMMSGDLQPNQGFGIGNIYFWMRAWGEFLETKTCQDLLRCLKDAHHSDTLLILKHFLKPIDGNPNTIKGKIPAKISPSKRCFELIVCDAAVKIIFMWLFGGLLVCCQ